MFPCNPFFKSHMELVHIDVRSECLSCQHIALTISFVSNHIHSEHRNHCWQAWGIPRIFVMYRMVMTFQWFKKGQVWMLQWQKEKWLKRLVKQRTQQMMSMLTNLPPSPTENLSPVEAQFLSTDIKRILVTFSDSKLLCDKCDSKFKDNVELCLPLDCRHIHVEG